MHVVRLNSVGSLAALREAWNAIDGGVPFRSWDWLEAWWRHYGVRDDRRDSRLELYVLAVYADDVLVGLAPWYLSSSWSQGRVLRFLGSGEVCSDHLSLLSRPGQERAVAHAVADWLLAPRPAMEAKRSPSAWDAIDLEGVDRGDEALDCLVERLTWHGCRSAQQPAAHCWVLSPSDGWPAYVARLSKSHRKQVRRVEQRLWRSGRARLVTVEHMEDFPRAFEVLVSLHQKRRESLGDDGCFRSARFTSFQREVMRRLLAQGRLRLQWVELDGRPVAIEYVLTVGSRWYAYQSGVDPAALDCEPGRLSTVALVQSWLASGGQSLDFLRGDEPYKAHWRAEPRPTQNRRVAAATQVGLARHAWWWCEQRLRATARAWRAARRASGKVAQPAHVDQPGNLRPTEPVPVPWAAPVPSECAVEADYHPLSTG